MISVNENTMSQPSLPWMTFHQYNIELKSIPIETETNFFIRNERKKIIIQIRHNGLKGKNGPLWKKKTVGNERRNVNFKTRNIKNFRPTKKNDLPKSFRWKSFLSFCRIESFFFSITLHNYVLADKKIHFMWNYANWNSYLHIIFLFEVRIKVFFDGKKALNVPNFGTL